MYSILQLLLPKHNILTSQFKDHVLWEILILIVEPSVATTLAWRQLPELSKLHQRFTHKMTKHPDGVVIWCSKHPVGEEQACISYHKMFLGVSKQCLDVVKDQTGNSLNIQKRRLWTATERRGNKSQAGCADLFNTHCPKFQEELLCLMSQFFGIQFTGQ